MRPWRVFGIVVDVKVSTPMSASSGRTLPKGLQTAEEELRYVVDAAVKPHHRHAIAHRLGWAGEPVPTLARLGKDLALSRLPNQVSRERMRQIEAHALAQMRERFGRARLPKVAAAVRLVVRSTPIAEDAIPSLLRQRGLAKATVTFDALASAAAIFALPFPVQKVRTRTAAIVADESMAHLCRAVYRAIAYSRGPVRLTELAARIGAQENDVRRLVDALGTCRWLARGLFWRLPRKPTGNKVIFVCAKLFSSPAPPASSPASPARPVSRRATARDNTASKADASWPIPESLTLEEIMSALARCRTVRQAPPANILLAMLQQTGWFVCEPGGDGKTNRVRPAEGVRFHALGGQDYRLIRAAQGRLGDVVAFKTLRDGLVAQGMSANHANVVIQTSPFLFRLSKGRYRVLAGPRPAGS